MATELRWPDGDYLCCLAATGSKQNCCFVTELRPRGRPRRSKALSSSVRKGVAQRCTLEEIVRELTPMSFRLRRPLQDPRWRRLEDFPISREHAKIGAALMRSVIGIAGFTLAIVSPTIGSAATIEEVAHCRAIPQLAERLNCFKSLKPGPRAKTRDAAPAKVQNAGPSKMKDAAGVKMKPAAPAKTEQAAPAKIEQAAPAKTEQAAPAKTEQAAPASTEEIAPAKSEKTSKSKPDEALSSPTPDDPATTSSIDRLSVAGQPLCVDAEGVAAMIFAGLLTSDPTKAATSGCQTLPGDAKLELLEGYPSVFPSIRIVRVRVTSPTQPDLKFGFTIETGR